MTTVYENFVKAHQTQERQVKPAAAATYLFVEELVLLQDMSINKALQFAHADLVEHHSIMRTVKTLRGYHSVCAWLMAEVGSIHWVSDRTYTQHLRAQRSGWTRVRLTLETPTMKRNGFMSASAYRRIKAGLTEANNGLTVLEAEIEVSRGATKKELIASRDGLLGLPEMRDRFLEHVGSTA